MRNFTQLLVSSLLVASQATTSLPRPVAAQSTANAVPAAVNNIKIELTTASAQPVQLVVASKPNIETEMLDPIRAAQAAKAQAEAAAAAAAKARAGKVATQTLPASVPHVLSAQAIQSLGLCESGLTANRNSGNGFYGAFQFTIGTWNSMGTGYARADLAPLEVQINAVQALVARSNIYGQFPACARKIHAAGLI